jgi:hypothetical protein
MPDLRKVILEPTEYYHIINELNYYIRFSFPFYVNLDSTLMS